MEGLYAPRPIPNTGPEAYTWPDEGQKHCLGGGGAVTQLLVQFSYLQLLDLLTTVAFLVQGVQEGNPFVAFLMDVSPSPVLGLVFAKMLALGLGVYTWKAGRKRLLARINLLFAVVIAWNLLALIVASVKAA